MYNLNGFMSFKGTVFIVKPFLCQMNWWIIDKQNKLYPYLAIILSNGNAWNTDTCYSMNKASEILCWMKEVRYKVYVLYTSIYIKCSENKSTEFESRLVFVRHWKWGWWVTASGTRIPWGWCNCSVIGCGEVV